MKDLNLISPHKFTFTNDGFEEMEGRFFERFGRLPNAWESMTFYALETKQCPMCEEKFKNTDGITEHMVMKHVIDLIPEDEKPSLLQAIQNAKLKSHIRRLHG